MSYELALQAAGAQVEAFESFGSYQGDWLAKVFYKGETLYVRGAFGSCSGCDSFQSEFNYDEEKCDEHRYEHNEEYCSDCATKKTEYDKHLAEFGRGYLDNPFTKEEMVKEFTEQSEWDSDAPDVLKWLSSS